MKRVTKRMEKSTTSMKLRLQCPPLARHGMTAGLSSLGSLNEGCCVFVVPHRRLLPDQRLRSHVPDPQPAGGAGGPGAADAQHPPPVAPPAYQPAVRALRRRLPGTDFTRPRSRDTHKHTRGSHDVPALSGDIMKSKSVLKTIVFKNLSNDTYYTYTILTLC